MQAEMESNLTRKMGLTVWGEEVRRVQYPLHNILRTWGRQRGRTGKWV